MRPNQIRQLLLNNRKRGYFRAEASGEEATIYLYDLIVSDEYTAEWVGGVSPEAFAKTLAGIDAATIHLRINSPGGDVFAARAIEQAVRQKDAKVIAHVDGYAASAASIVAIAGDEVEIAKGGFFMIHESWTIAFGNKGDFLHTAALLEKVDATLAQTYVDETGMKLEDIIAWMTAETWFTGDEAVEFGFADRLAGEKVKASAADFDLSAYRRPPISAPESRERGLGRITTPAVKADLGRFRRELDLRTRGISAAR